MSHSAFDFEKNKLQQWKSAPLVDDEYFAKLPMCVMQRIQMNEEMKKDAIHFNPVVSNNKKNYRILHYISGIAAVLMISFGLFYHNTSYHEQHVHHESKNTIKNNEKTLGQESTIENKNDRDMQKKNNSVEIKKTDCVPEYSVTKSHISSSDPFETALQSISDDELEELNWTLYLNETF